MIVVDNASSDNSADQIAPAFPNVELIRNKENVGFAAGNNQVIRRLLNEGPEFIWLLNNDTVIDAKCHSRLLEVMRAEPDVAVSSGKIYFENPPDTLWYAGAKEVRWVLEGRHRGALEKDLGQYDLGCDVPFVSGCCMFTRPSAFHDVGLLKERYFAYEEDLDWCIRATSMGKRLRYVPQAKLWHKVSASIRSNTLKPKEGSGSPFGYYLSFRNKLWTARTYSCGYWHLGFLVVRLFSRALWLSAGMLILRRFGKIAALWKGFTQGLFLKC